ncbi:MAG: hypothetical protein JWO79_4285, partial [Actinomycetia bacterium]|nr:hypothetical protein [Actinomycetes bacterium]
MASHGWTLRQGTRSLLAVVAVLAAAVGVIAGVFTLVSPGTELSTTPLLAAARNIEVGETSRLDDRRTMASGDRAYEVGAADGRYPATGTAIRGE